MPMFRFLCAIFLLTATACGLSDDPREEQNKHTYIDFSDPAFEAYCLAHFDINGDKRISRYEAQRVLRIDCPALGIASLNEIAEFSRLQRLDCSGNLLTQLDLKGCAGLQQIACGNNALSLLDINGLRSLTSLRCAVNRLPRLDLQSNVSLSTLECRDNLLTTLDVALCAQTMELVDARGNASLTTLYYATGQQIRSLQIDGKTIPVER